MNITNLFLREFFDDDDFLVDLFGQNEEDIYIT